MKVFDLHCDTLSELRYAERRGEAKSFAANDLHIDLETVSYTHLTLPTTSRV